jgi:hypothetical protein
MATEQTSEAVSSSSIVDIVAKMQRRTHNIFPKSGILLSFSAKTGAQHPLVDLSGLVSHNRLPLLS